MLDLNSQLLKGVTIVLVSVFISAMNSPLAGYFFACGGISVLISDYFTFEVFGNDRV